MPRYHIDNKGNPGVCTASTRNCPLSPASDHYDTKEEARANFEFNQEFENILEDAKNYDLFDKKAKFPNDAAKQFAESYIRKVLPGTKISFELSGGDSNNIFFKTLNVSYNYDVVKESHPFYNKAKTEKRVREILKNVPGNSMTSVVFTNTSKGPVKADDKKVEKFYLEAMKLIKEKSTSLDDFKKFVSMNLNLSTTQKDKAYWKAISEKFDEVK